MFKKTSTLKNIFNTFLMIMIKICARVQGVRKMIFLHNVHTILHF